MSRMECSECGYVSTKPINCAHCGGNYTMREVDDERDALRAEVAKARECVIAADLERHKLRAELAEVRRTSEWDWDQFKYINADIERYRLAYEAAVKVIEHCVDVYDAVGEQPTIIAWRKTHDALYRVNGDDQ